MPFSSRCSSGEDALIFPFFDYDTRLAIGLGAVCGQRTNKSTTIAITIRRGPQRAFHAALRGSSAADNDAWLDRKCAVVERFGDSLVFRGVSLSRAEGEEGLERRAPT